MDVSATLQQGVEILAPALTPHGFCFGFRNADKGSGGHFACELAVWGAQWEAVARDTVPFTSAAPAA